MIYLIILVALIVLDAVIDTKLISKHKNVHTFWQYFVRLSVFVQMSILNGHGDFQKIICSFVCTCFVYWWTFDTVLNLLRGEKYYYLSDRGIDGVTRPLVPVFYVKLIFAVLAAAYFIKPALFEY